MEHKIKFHTVNTHTHKIHSVKYLSLLIVRKLKKNIEEENIEK